MDTFERIFNNAKVLCGKTNHIYNFLRPPVRTESSGKTKRRDVAKELLFKKFQKSAMKHENFVIREQTGKRLWGFITFYGTDNREVITKL